MLKDMQAPYTISELAAMKLHQNAVKFGEELTSDDGKARPFHYSFVPGEQNNSFNSASSATNIPTGSPLDLGQQIKPQPQGSFTVTQPNLRDPDGILLPIFNGIGTPRQVDIPIRISRESTFHLLEVRYTVHEVSSLAPFISRSFYNGTNPQDQDGFPRYLSHPYKFPVQMLESLRVSLYVKSGVERDLYGGNRRTQTRRGTFFGETPLIPSAIQGYDDGRGNMRTPYVLSRESVVVIRVQSFENNFLRINGCLFGYHVTA